MTRSAGANGATALALMRAQLRPYHDSIERSLDLMNRDVDRLRYVRFVEKSYGFIAACERHLDVAGAPPSLGIERRLKTPLLRDNLIALGYDDHAIDHLALCERLPQVAGWPAALGYCYVIEGSTLGGELLARHFGKRLGINDEALAFLHGYRSGTGAMWKQTVAVLEDAMSNAAAADDITTSARDTFTLLERWHQVR
jgi:heme oxygenase (biliverdin-IX-beta and delta-forming)